MTTAQTWESRLPGRLGVARAEIRAARKVCAEGSDWRWIGNRVVWTDFGLTRLASILGKKGDGVAQDANGGEKSAPAQAVAQEHGNPLTSESEKTLSLIVTRIPLNPRLLFAADGVQVYRVRVHLSSKYVVGMEIVAQHIEGDVCQVVGRAPRWRGKW